MTATAHQQSRATAATRAHPVPAPAPSATTALRAAPAASTRRQVGWLLGGAVLFVALGLLGRATIIDGQALSLVWPAAGAGILMVALATRPLLPVAVVMVGVATYVLNAATGASPVLSAVFVGANVVQAAVGGLLLRRLVPRVRGAGQLDEAARMRDFLAIVLVSLVSSGLGAALGSLGLDAVLDNWSWVNVLVWWGRNVTGGMVVVTIVLLARDHARERHGTWSPGAVPGGRARLLELGLLVASTAGLYVLFFELLSDLPLLFPLLLPAVWAGLRFRPLVVALLGVVFATAVVTSTLLMHGPFVLLGSWTREALVSQLFLGMVFGLGMLLSLGREERLALADAAARTRVESDRQAAMMAAIIDSMHDGLTLVDDQGTVLMRNPAGVAMARADGSRSTAVTQYTLVDATGRALEHHELPQIRVFTGEDYIGDDVILTFADGSPSRTLSVSARKLPSPDGTSPDRAVLIYHDVTTDRVQRRALESFAGVVAHDLRGPLGVIEGWVEMLDLDLTETGSLDADTAAPKLDKVQQAAQTMRRLIGDLLDSATSRDQQLRLSDVNLNALARAVAGAHTSGTGEQPRIEVGYLPPVHADEAMVRQVLDNLVGNAVKYVVPGEVPEIRLSGRVVVGEQVEVTVADHGIGIPGEQRDLIFDAFHRAHQGAGYEGHGIGLAVCQRIVERHGGRIAARSPLDGRGTRIVFTLPRAAGAPTAPTGPGATAGDQQVPPQPTRSTDERVGDGTAGPL